MNNINNNSQIKTINTHTVKRLHNEIIELYSKYKNIKIKYTEKIIYITINRIEIHINDKYPFHPPDVFLFKTPYINHLRPRNEIIRNSLNKYIKSNCLCCTSILCFSNWVATLTIEKILNEINYINELKRIVKYDIAINILFDKKKLPIDLGYKIFEYLIYSPESHLSSIYY
jgi:ubiquitin-protein ligase